LTVRVTAAAGGIPIRVVLVTFICGTAFRHLTLTLAEKQVASGGVEVGLWCGGDADSQKHRSEVEDGCEVHGGGGGLF